MNKNIKTMILAIAMFSFNFMMIGNGDPSIAWSKTTYDLGRIDLNVPVEVTFSFQNNGETPLTLLEAKPACGCTVASFTSGEIKAGEYGEVKATYNASKTGMFSKTISVLTSTSAEPIILTLKGEVK